MRPEGLRIGNLFGIPIFLHTSWFIIFALMTYSFFTQFGSLNVNLNGRQQIILALLTSFLFFGSLVLHEVCHSLVAKYYKIPVASITLFVFGGVSRIVRDPSRAVEEFNISVVGPLSNFVLAGGFALVSHFARQNVLLKDLAGWLAVINFSLGAFNLLPGFPLDGGRIFRALVWGVTKNYARATRIAVGSSYVVAYGMVALGVVVALQNWAPLGGTIGGVWLAFIGWFLLSAARQNRAQADARGALEGLLASDIMTADLPIIARDISLEDYAREVMQTGRRAHLVVAHEQLVGLMTIEALHAVPREDWDVTSVQAAMVPKDKLPWASPEEPALNLLDRMRNIGLQQIPVISGGNVVGVVTRDSIVHVLQSRAAFHSPGAR